LQNNEKRRGKDAQRRNTDTKMQKNKVLAFFSVVASSSNLSTLFCGCKGTKNILAIISKTFFSQKEKYKRVTALSFFKTGYLSAKANKFVFTRNLHYLCTHKK
jgi:hypothetical protein